MKIRPHLEPVIVFGATMAGILLLLSACAWSVPADPGLNARLRGRGAAADAEVSLAPSGSAGAWADTGARDLYRNHCARCHEPIPPASMAAADWPRFVRHYGPRAGLFGADRARVLRWLQAHAR